MLVLLHNAFYVHGFDDMIFLCEAEPDLLNLAVSKGL